MSLASPHKRFYPKPTDKIRVAKFHVLSGMIVEFMYTNKSGENSKPLLFVMDTDEQEPDPKKRSFSGINLNYLPIHEVERFFVRTLQKTGWEIDRHTKAAKVDLWEEEDEGLKPIVLYNKIVKKSLLPKYQCWRSYSYHRITDIYQIRFHFTTPPLNLIYEGSKRLGRANENEIKRILNTVNKK